MQVAGLQKLTLLDYPGKTAAIVFFAGCNLRCPFCHNAPLVLNKNLSQISEQEVLDYLIKRRNVLQGVCITGGEPLLNDGLEAFIKQIKELGYAVKLDTNGCFPDKLTNLLDKKLIDYVAMDIKNSPQKYALTAGIINLDLTPIYNSIDIIKSLDIEYEFRTTLVKEFHTPEDLIIMGKWLKGAKNYYLQALSDSENLIGSRSLTAFSKQEMQSAADTVRQYIPSVKIRC